jgi:hypothetical protein
MTTDNKSLITLQGVKSKAVRSSDTEIDFKAVGISGTSLTKDQSGAVKVASRFMTEAAEYANDTVIKSQLDNLESQLSEDIGRVLADKLLGVRTKIANVMVVGHDEDISILVDGAVSDRTRVTDITTETGVFVGQLTSPADPRKVIVRRAGTNNTYPDGMGGAVYGQLSDTGNATTVTFFRGNGTPFNFPIPTAVDLYVVEVFSEQSLPEDAFLRLFLDIQAEAISSTQLKVQEHATLKKRVVVTGSTQTMPDGTTSYVSLVGRYLKFDGAQIDFSTGNIYAADGTTPLGESFVPVTIAPGKGRWFCVSIKAQYIDALNRMVAVARVTPAELDGPSPMLSPRAAPRGGKGIAHVYVKNMGGVLGEIDEIYQSDIELDTSAGADDPGVIMLKEVPVGVIDGVNNEFQIEYLPVSPDVVDVYIDGLYSLDTHWNIDGRTIVFNPGHVPAAGSDIEVTYSPDPTAYARSSDPETPPGIGTELDTTAYFRTEIRGVVGSALFLGHEYTPGSCRLSVYRNGVLLNHSMFTGDAVSRYFEQSPQVVELATPAAPEDVFTAAYSDRRPVYRMVIASLSGSVVKTPPYLMGTDRLKVWRNGILLNKAGATADNSYVETSPTQITLAAPLSPVDVISMEITEDAPIWREDISGAEGDSIAFENSYTRGNKRLYVWRNGVLMSVAAPGEASSVDNYFETGPNSITLGLPVIATDVIVAIFV